MTAQEGGPSDQPKRNRLIQGPFEARLDRSFGWMVESTTDTFEDYMVAKGQAPRVRRRVVARCPNGFEAKRIAEALNRA